ncbi:MAG: hypothetical protein RLZ07_1042, partial [Pseudomonadota bacterium]
WHYKISKIGLGLSLLLKLSEGVIMNFLHIDIKNVWYEVKAFGYE